MNKRKRNCSIIFGVRFKKEIEACGLHNKKKNKMLLMMKRTLGIFIKSSPTASIVPALLLFI